MAVVAVVTSGAVGVAGVLTPAWLGLRADRMAEKRRTREKRETVYIDALEVAQVVSDYHVKGLYGDLAPSSEMVTEAYDRTHGDRSIRARIDAYGSEDMRRLWKAFDDAWEQVIVHTAVGQVEEGLSSLAGAAARMADQVNSELA